MVYFATFYTRKVEGTSNFFCITEYVESEEENFRTPVFKECAEWCLAYKMLNRSEESFSKQLVGIILQIIPTNNFTNNTNIYK